MTLPPTSPYTSSDPGAVVPYHNSGIDTPSKALCAPTTRFGAEEWIEISATQALQVGRPIRTPVNSHDHGWPIPSESTPLKWF